MRRFLLAVTLTGGTVIAIFVGLSGATPNRVATCPVWVSDEGLNLARDAGVSLRRNDRIRFPVIRTVLSDGGLSFDLPPAMVGIKDLVRVKDWNDCVIDAAGTFPAVIARWDHQFPFVFPGATARKCVRRNTHDAGLPCLRKLPDGGSFSFGEDNVFLRTDAVNPATCDPCECSIMGGEDPAVDL
ncbi:MAG: hypothetical protein Q8L48_16700 [Archangium sp.]|nr:hypothetical protein [Archangium sp.]